MASSSSARGGKDSKGFLPPRLCPWLAPPTMNKDSQDYQVNPGSEDRGDFSNCHIQIHSWIIPEEASGHVMRTLKWPMDASSEPGSDIPPANLPAMWTSLGSRSFSYEASDGCSPRWHGDSYLRSHSRPHLSTQAALHPPPP